MLFVIIHDKVIECDKYQVYSTSSCFRFGSHRSFLASSSFVFLYVSMSAKHFILLLLTSLYVRRGRTLEQHRFEYQYQLQLLHVFSIHHQRGLWRLF